MKRPPGMPGQPGLNRLGFVYRGGVENDMDIAVFGKPFGNRVEEVDELLVPMTKPVLPNHRTVKNVQCGK